MANEKEIFLSIKKLNKRFELNFNSALAEYDLTSQQGMVLFFLNRQVHVNNRIIHQNDIEKEFNISKSTVSALVDRLEKKQFIEKKNNYPYAELYLTDKGKQLADLFRKNWLIYLDKLFTGLNEEEKIHLLEVLNKLNSNIKEE